MKTGRTRLALLLVALALFAGACADDDGAGSPPESTTTTTTAPTTTPPTTAPLAPTTSTTAPTDPCPLDGDLVGHADLDGDGDDDQIRMTTTTTEMTISFCTQSGVRPLTLALDRWNLLVMDVEPDGVDEVLVGWEDFTTDVEGGGKYFWVDPRGPELTLHTEDYAGIWLQESAGMGCVDHDGDGDRELVALWIDEERSNETTLAWSREISSAIPGQGDAEPVLGEFRTATDRRGIELLTTVSCGDATPNPVTVTPRALCDSAREGHFIDVDVDGDGRDDLLAQGSTAGELGYGPAILVCLADGTIDRVLVGGMGEVFGVTVGFGDVPVIWAGGTTVGAAYSDPYIVHEGSLVPMTIDGSRVVFVDGSEGQDTRRRSGCDDLDGDGITEYVQLSGERDGEEIAWTRQSWEPNGPALELATDESGRLPWPAPEPDEGWFDAPDEWIALGPDGSGCESAV